MPHINIKNEILGIRGLMEYKPKSGKALTMLAQALLVEDSPLSRFEREVIATYVSSLNKCEFCRESHRAIAKKVGGVENEETVDAIIADPTSAPISDKLKSLLQLASMVQKTGPQVTDRIVGELVKGGISEEEVHDTVLIAAAFCMFNRYVDGLGASKPKDISGYQQSADLISKMGYVREPNL